MRRLYPIIMTIPLVFATLLHSGVAKADFWGGDLPLLAQILTQAIQEVTLLQQTLQVAKGDSDLLAKVNRDIEKSLTEIHAMQDFVRETTEVGRIKDPQQLLIQLQDIYGRIPKIGDLKGITLTDRIAGTGLGVDNDTHEHARLIDRAALTLQDEAKNAAPGRAQQLTAQSQTTVLHSLAQLERTNATLVRVASAQLAMENQREKDRVEAFDQSYSALATSQAGQPADLTLGGLK